MLPRYALSDVPPLQAVIRVARARLPHARLPAPLRVATEHFTLFFHALALRPPLPAVEHDKLPASVAACPARTGGRERLAAVLALPNEERLARMGAWEDLNATYAAPRV